MNVIYRLRRIDALLSEFHELEQQEIYLSPPERLNDPMEGYRDVFWHGDETLWENLFAHYLLTLLWATIYCRLSENDAFDEPSIPAALSERDLPSDRVRETYREVRRRFFADSAIQAMPRILASFGAPLRAHGLRGVLGTLHRAACKAVTEELAQRGMIPSAAVEAFSSIAYAAAADSAEQGKVRSHAMPSRLLEELSAGIADPAERSKVLEGFGFAMLTASNNQALAMHVRLAPGNSRGLIRKYIFILLDFPRRYVDAISDGLSHHSKWYTACFTATCENASMWSVYGDEHRGAALMFKPKLDATGAPTLTLSRVTGISYSPSHPDGVHSTSALDEPLHQVIYTSRAPEVDFFQSLGVLPHPQLERQWYMDHAGTVSPLLQHQLSDKAAWRQRYWNSVLQVARTKLEDWKHEQEYRLVVNDILGFHKTFPKVKFEFSQLTGIVFGMKTAMKDRLAIIEIVRAKCEREKRNDFEIKQVAYRPTEGRLVLI